MNKRSKYSKGKSITLYVHHLNQESINETIPKNTSKSEEIIKTYLTAKGKPYYEDVVVKARKKKV